MTTQPFNHWNIVQKKKKKIFIYIIEGATTREEKETSSRARERAESVLFLFKVGSVEKEEEAI